MGKARDLTGLRFGRLTVLERAYSKNNRIFWLCKCDCGNNLCVSTNKLTTGHVKSCKCLRNTLSGESRSNLYKRWQSIHMRCREESEHKEHYFDRGITVCEEWKGHDGFLNFKKWALENGYKEELTIDRIDNNKGYSPENCRWVNMYVQNNNRTDNHYVTIGCETKTLSQWSKEFSLDYRTVKARIHRGIGDLEALEVV